MKPPFGVVLSFRPSLNNFSQKSYQQVFYRFSLFPSDSFKGFFGSNGGFYFIEKTGQNSVLFL